MITPLILPPEKNLSLAWGKAFLELMKPGAHIRHPAVITIQGFKDASNIEESNIRSCLDSELHRLNENSCETVANTIFPISMWNPLRADDADLLYQRYERAWPGIKMSPQNRNGVYFRRLTSYQTKIKGASPVNQLEFITNTYRTGNHRKSALQASIFDPTRDHTDARQRGFPCLQQVAFTPIGNNELSVTGYYAKQLHFEKAYGNYLGLYNLGKFMAKQLGLTLNQVVCIASCLECTEKRIGDIKNLANEITPYL